MINDNNNNNNNNNNNSLIRQFIPNAAYNMSMRSLQWRRNPVHAMNAEPHQMAVDP